MILQEITKRDVATAQSADTVANVARTMQSQNVGAVVIVSDHKVIGIITDRDIALSLGLGKSTPDTPIGEIMTREVQTIWEDQGVFNVTQYFHGHKVRRLPVIDRQDRLVGMVTVDDLVALLAREMINVAQSLEPAIGQRV